jgi:Domain of unknown function DUF29
MDTVTLPADRALYEADEHAWIARQIEALRSGRLHELDRDSLVEYLTEMTIRDRRELKNRLIVLLQHLLKVRMQPQRLTRSWVLTVLAQQQQIRDILAGTPSIATYAPALFEEAYPNAVRRAAAETGIPFRDFPSASPWTLEAALAFAVPDPPPPPRYRRADKRK